MDLATAQSKLAAWQAVEDALTSGQSYQLPEVSVQRVDARFVAQRIQHYERLIARLTLQASGITNTVTTASFS